MSENQTSVLYPTSRHSSLMRTGTVRTIAVTVSHAI